jgi:hypothetical protein
MVDNEMLQRLRSVPLFADMSERELKDVMNQTRIVEHYAPLLESHPTMARVMLLGLCQHLRAAEARSG